MEPYRKGGKFLLRTVLQSRDEYCALDVMKTKHIYRTVNILLRVGMLLNGIVSETRMNYGICFRQYAI